MNDEQALAIIVAILGAADGIRYQIAQVEAEVSKGHVGGDWIWDTDAERIEAAREILASVRGIGGRDFGGSPEAVKRHLTGEVVAEIGRAPLNGDAPPPFRMLTRSERFDRDRQDPGCQHSGFVLDEKRRTVECGKCGCIVDAFEALMTFATWADWYVARARDYKYQQYEGWRHTLQTLKHQRFVSDEERAEIEKWLSRGIPSDTEPLRVEGEALHKRISETRRNRKIAARRARLAQLRATRGTSGGPGGAKE
jgi:hypothetical protein